MAIVIATRNRRTELRKTLDRLRSLPERPHIVVVDNGSTDDTAELFDSTPRVTLISLPNNLGAAARTMGAQVSCSELVAFADDDSWWAPGSLANAHRLFMQHSDVGLIMGRILLGEDQHEDPLCSIMRDSPLKSEDGHPLITGFAACGAIVRRDAFLEVGGFLAQFGLGGEENLLAIDLMEAGWSCIYSDEIVVHHHPSAARDRRARHRRTVRNCLWSAWLRLPPRDLVAASLRILENDQPGTKRGAIDAAMGWRSLRHLRRRVSERTADQLRQVSMAT